MNEFVPFLGEAVFKIWASAPLLQTPVANLDFPVPFVYLHVNWRLLLFEWACEASFPSVVRHVLSSC